MSMSEEEDIEYFQECWNPTHEGNSNMQQQNSEALNNKNKLLNTTQWYIRSNMPGDSSEFLKTLSDAIECYNLYYKHQMENNLHDTLPELETDIHFFQILHEIKHNFIKHFSLLQTL